MISIRSALWPERTFLGQDRRSLHLCDGVRSEALQGFVLSDAFAGLKEEEDSTVVLDVCLDAGDSEGRVEVLPCHRPLA